MQTRSEQPLAACFERKYQGLLCLYCSKGTNLLVHSQEHLGMIARRLNERPRQSLNFETPAGIPIYFFRFFDFLLSQVSCSFTNALRSCLAVSDVLTTSA